MNRLRHLADAVHAATVRGLPGQDLQGLCRCAAGTVGALSISTVSQ
jgi:hypothetical protein